MTTTTMPESVVIGPFRYTVVVEDAPFINDDNTGVLQGECNHHEQRIRVMQCAPASMYVTLWHEILHGIDRLAGTELSEDQVNRLAPLLVSVLLDNGYVERGEP